jgi:hypothetical protein
VVRRAFDVATEAVADAVWTESLAATAFERVLKPVLDRLSPPGDPAFIAGPRALARAAAEAAELAAASLSRVLNTPPAAVAGAPRFGSAVQTTALVVAALMQRQWSRNRAPPYFLRRKRKASVRRPRRN